MKKQTAIKTLALSLSLSMVGGFIISPLSSYAADNYFNYSSPFYRSSKTKAAYSNLTGAQRRELDAINTDGKSPLTIDEVAATGRYKIPVVRGSSWLYPFMLDRDGDGQVGEGYHAHLSPSTDLETAYAILPQDIQDKIDTTNGLPPVDEVINIINEDTAEVEKAIEREEREQELSKLSTRERLIAVVEEAKIKINAAEFIMKKMPTFTSIHGDELRRLVEESKVLILEAELMINEMEIREVLETAE